MSETTFKVGDRVRVANELLETNGMFGNVCGVGGDLCLVTLDAYGTRSYKQTSLLHANKQHRLPQVGEVWRMRNGECVGPLFDNNNSRSWPLATYLSNGNTRAWSADGRYSSHIVGHDLDLVELVSEAQQPAEVPVSEPPVEEAPQNRLPQVGEVWRSRDGKFTTNPLRAPIHDAMPFCAVCSDGIFRTWTEDGSFLFRGGIHDKDLVELVSEAQPEPTSEAPQKPAERFADGQYWTNAGMDFIAGPDWSFIYETTANGNVKRHTARCSDGIRRWWCDDGKCVSGGNPAIQNDLVRQVDADAKPVERKAFPLSNATDLAVLMDALAGRKGEHQKAIAEVYVELCTFTLKKNSDYGSSVFKRPMFAKECDPGAAIRVRMSDKFERMLSLSEKPPEVAGESLEDSIDDFVNYRILQKVSERLNAKT